MVDEESVDPPTTGETIEATTDAPPGEDHTDSETETLYLELDPARTQMYRMARQAGGEKVDAILAEQLETAVVQLYDQREQLRAEREAEEAESVEQLLAENAEHDHE